MFSAEAVKVCTCFMMFCPTTEPRKIAARSMTKIFGFGVPTGFAGGAAGPANATCGKTKSAAATATVRTMRDTFFMEITTPFLR
jgi:hypothetical protein